VFRSDPGHTLLIAITLPAAWNGGRHGSVFADNKRSPPVAKSYGKGLMGCAFALVILALLIHWIGIDTIAHYRADLWFYLQAHLVLVLLSMVAALAVGIPAGIALSRPHRVDRAERFMQFFNIGNTIPPLAVLAIALSFLGIGAGPAIFALFLASLLPIVRNTYEGLKNVPASLKEAATGIGMTPRQSLWRVELPNAVPIIVGGVRVALAINVGTAPLSFLIGANSLGSLIFPGIALNNQPQLLLGAACTALLALLLDALVAQGSRRWLERGLAH
jgi:osmoprotectant transport system permease protein